MSIYSFSTKGADLFEVPHELIEHSLDGWLLSMLRLTVNELNSRRGRRTFLRRTGSVPLPRMRAEETGSLAVHRCGAQVLLRFRKSAAVFHV